MPPRSRTKTPPRILLENVEPTIDCGRFRAKQTLGRRVVVSADVIRDGHEVLGARVRYKGPSAKDWSAAPLDAVGNDRFEGAFEATACGIWQFEIEAWSDRAATWRSEVRRKLDAGQADLASELAEGAALLEVEKLDIAVGLESTASEPHDQVSSGRFEVEVDRVLATAGSWYELFPRSFGGFAGVEAVLPELAELGFDVVYFPPIHPIGRSGRKGRNNAPEAKKGDPGSPWAIGAAEGGHDAIHPELGTIEEFDRLVARARELDLEIALDFAIQCSPDHPWLTEHPDWFQRRPDGTIKYAENPPKRYQDIVNVDWDTPDREGLWNALRDVVLHWATHGVHVFRVDNPHTKPLPFWEWLIAEVRRQHPDTIFLAEAFTRPAMMRALAKAGFSQSYTYFTWKNTKHDLVEYMDELTGEMASYYRPNFFANTPDILHEYLQSGGRPAFEARLVLAATLSPSYGIYSGYEAIENVAVAQGSEEYLDSEKYELKKRKVEGPLLPLIAKLNAIRRAHAPFRRLDNVTFLDTAHDDLIAYAKRSDSETLIVCVNLDPAATHEGLITVPASFGLPAAFAVQDLVADTTFAWQTGGNYVSLGPGRSHVLQAR
ncbi:MAG TPA: alpha-1,4-glucan--maltose-1-phosphate maltosyltransferase [Gaiellaceae bacterium]|nr:alpha-1,4-glucan--maltose-1-phosphate maltosyltransferase [Gaiellaceae bacterium]